MTPLGYFLIYMLLNSALMLTVIFIDPRVIPNSLGPVKSFLATVMILLMLIPVLIILYIGDFFKVQE